MIKHFGLSAFLGVLCAGFFGLSVSPAYADDPTTIDPKDSYYEANKQTPGARVDLKMILANDKATLLFIHSEHFGPCKRMAPKIHKLAEAKPDIKVVELMLDGEAEKAIGWESAAAKQFNIHAVPAYLIYDKDGKQIASGTKAKDNVKGWLLETGIITESDK